MVKPITVEKLYDLYLDTLGRCTSDILDRTDDRIAYDLFEEFDVGATSFLYETSLDRLIHAGCITAAQAATAARVRQLWFELNAREWSIAQIKTSSEWRQLFDLCDRLIER